MMPASSGAAVTNLASLGGGARSAAPEKSNAQTNPPATNAGWDDALLGFDDASLEQSASYCALRWCGHEEAGPVLSDLTGTLAMARVLTYAMPGISGGLAYVKFGPVWRRRDSAADLDVYGRIAERLVAEYCQRRRMLLTIHPRPHPSAQAMERSVLEEFGFQQRRRHADCNRYLVNLAIDEATQRASLEQKWRYNLKKSEKARLDISEESTTAGVASFQALHAQMVARKNASHGDPVEHLDELCGCLSTALRPRVILARRDGQPVAGAVIAVHGDTAYYLYGATADEALELRAGYALQWWIVQMLSNSGAAYYDLGGMGGASGLRQFKQGLVGKQGCITEMAGEFDYWHHPRDRALGDAVYLLRRCSTAASSLKRLLRLS